MTGGVKKYETIIKKRGKNMIKQYCQEKSSKALSKFKLEGFNCVLNSCINYQKFVSVYNMSREYNEIRKKKLMKNQCRNISKQ